MKTINHPVIQKVFVVTVWQQPEHGVDCSERWRFRLEDPQTNHKRIFASSQGLIVALKEGTLASVEAEERDLFEPEP